MPPKPSKTPKKTSKANAGNAALAQLEKRIARIEAVEAIGNLVAMYARGADRKNDPAVFRKLYDEDSVWEANGFGRFKGRDAIVAATSKVAREQILWCIHYMVDPLIEIAPSGKKATCSWYLWELAKMPDDSGALKDNWIAGYYDSALSKGPKGWVFDQIKFDIRMIGPTDVPWVLAGTSAP
jgi:SnoaL-like domain